MNLVWGIWTTSSNFLNSVQEIFTEHLQQAKHGDIKEKKTRSLLSKGSQVHGKGQWFSALGVHQNHRGDYKMQCWDSLPMFLISLVWGKASVFLKNSQLILMCNQS